MPAIRLAHLRKQVAQLADLFDQPEAFLRELHSLLDFYADRTHRPGRAGEPPPLLTPYKVPKPVLRQIQAELAPLASAQPEAAFKLCDALWKEPYLEFGLISAALLGLVSVEPAEPILQRVSSQATPQTEERLSIALLNQGFSRLRQEKPEILLRQIETWLTDEGIFYKQLGLRALLPFLSRPEFENLPAFFRLLNPLFRSTPPGLRPDLLDILRALARRAPQETAYSLRQTLEMANSPDTAWLIRQCLQDFPAETRSGLQTAVRKFGKSAA